MNVGDIVVLSEDEVIDEYRYSVYWMPGGGILDDYETSFERLQ